MTIRLGKLIISKKTALAIAMPPGILFFTLIAIFFGKGYNINVTQRTVDKTGMLVVKSQPDGAKIYLDNEWKSATPFTFSNLRPKTYLVRVEKDGFSTWEKPVNVYPELVTDITSVLVSATPKLEPLTYGGAASPSYSDSAHAIAYGTQNSKPGIWVLPVGKPLPITLFQSNPSLVMPDTETTKYSKAVSYNWSPIGDQLLVKITDEDYRLIDVNQSKELEQASTSADILNAWSDEITKKKVSFLEKQTITADLAQIATASGTLWSPDGLKFAYKVEENGSTVLKIHNMEKPTPIDEKTDYVTLTAATGTTLSAYIWYPDSYHLVLKDGNSLYLVRIDGTNKTEIYSGVINGEQFFVTPDGNKVIINASFKKDATSELYAISLR
ncbi:MAG: PEGA domain-containing protein [candidate division WWE3 bacterium]|nr:PEGA domain-containing protein [candidate division WWE3 bacterium]